MYTSLPVCVILSEAVLSPPRPVLSITSEVFDFSSPQRKLICHDLQPGDWFRLVVSVRTHHSSGTDSRRFPFRCHLSAGGGEQGLSWPVPSGQSCPALLCCPVCAMLPALLLPLLAVPEPAEEPGKVWDSYCPGAGSRSFKERPSPGDVGKTLPLKLVTEGVSPILALACVSCALGSPGRGSPSPCQDGAPLTVSLLLCRLGSRHPRRRPRLCGGEEPGGVPRLRHPLLPHLPGEPPPCAGCSKLMLTAWGLGAGVFQLRASVCRGHLSLDPVGWIAGSHWDCSRPARGGERGLQAWERPGAALRVCLSEVGPAGALPGGWGFWVPALLVAVAARQTSLSPSLPLEGDWSLGSAPSCVCAPVSACVCVHEPVCALTRLLGAHLRGEAAPSEVASGTLRGPLPQP